MATILSYMNKNIKIAICLWHVHHVAYSYLGNTVLKVQFQLVHVYV